MKLKNSKIIAVAAAAAVALSITVYAAYDSASDPLISLSYLTDVFAPKIKSEIDMSAVKKEILAEVEEDINALQKQIDALTNEYAYVNLKKGQKLTLGTSGDIVVIEGKAVAVCASSKTHIIDASSSVALHDGDAVAANHRIIVPVGGDGRGISALENVTVLVKGEYTVG